MNLNLPDQLTVALRQTDSHRERRRLLAPDLSYGRQSGPPLGTARRAAVMILLYPKSGQWHIPLTLRPEHLPSHAGQISFPGGLAEPGESSQQTARRELEEELGISKGIRTVATLAEFYVFVTNYRVTPWIAVVDTQPNSRPDPAEVSEVLEVPVAELLRPDTMDRFLVVRGPLTFSAPCFLWEGRRIWGATAMMLSELLSVIDPLGV